MECHGSPSACLAAKSLAARQHPGLRRIFQMGPVPGGLRWQTWVEARALAAFTDFEPHPLQLGEIRLESGALSGCEPAPPLERQKRPSRIAHVISRNSERLEATATLLHKHGFEVIAVAPANDSRVTALIRKYHHASDPTHMTPLGIASNLITHVDLWSAVRRDEEAEHEWRYIFEDDIEPFLSRGLARSTHANVSGAAAAADNRAASTQCMLDQLEERASRGNHSLLYLGAAASGERMSYHGWLQPTRAADRLACGRIAQPCAPLETHAYAVRLASGPSLWPVMRYMLEPATRKERILRYNIDTNIAAFYKRGRDHSLIRPDAEWPLCVDAPQGSHHLMSRSGLFRQKPRPANASRIAHKVNHWRRSRRRS